MYKMTRKIYEALKQSDGLKVFTEDRGNSSVVWLQFSADNGPSYRINFINTDDDSDTAVRVFGLISVEKNKWAKVLVALNKLNSDYRFVKFVLDDDGDVNIQYDFPVRADNVDECAEEIMIRVVQIIDDAYPVLMRAMWA